MSGLFETFSVSKRGMFVQQTALHTNAHNIANSKTAGYSVQRVNLKTTEPFGMPSLTTPAEPGQLGTGVKVDSITRSRDIFLDAQIRKENATQSKYQTREQFLSEIESIFMEPSNDGMANSLTNYWDAWHQLATNPESSTARTLVAENGDTLATSIKHNYTQLEDMEKNAGDLIRNDVFDVASILTQVKGLNDEIKAVSISGRNPNDLMDRRDLLLDRLSQKFSFEKKDTDYNGIEIIPKPVNKNIGTGAAGAKDGVILKDTKINYGIAYVNSIKYVATGKWEIQLHIDGDINKSVTVEADDVAVKKYLIEKDDTKKNKILDDIKNRTDKEIPSSSYLNVVNYEYDKVKDEKGNILDSITNKTTKLTNVDLSIPNYENGSINGLQTINDEIDKYKSQLNNMARILAISTNTIQTDSTDSTSGINFFDTKAETELEAAKNLKVNDAILKDVSLINVGKDIIDGKPGNGERALLMGALRNIRIDINKIDDINVSAATDEKGKIELYRKAFIENAFKDKDGITITDASALKDKDGKSNVASKNLVDEKNVKLMGSQSGTTINDYFKNSIAFLGVSNQEAKQMVSNQKSLLSQLNIRKESVSGVSLDEEVTNMIQFSKSYQANAKMISIIDQLLDVVVNGLIRR